MTYIDDKEIKRQIKKGAIYAGHVKNVPEKYKHRIKKQLREFVVIMEEK